jgi:hypothetical protein
LIHEVQSLFDYIAWFEHPVPSPSWWL